MTDAPNLTLPPRDQWSPAPRSRAAPATVVVGVLLAAVLGLEVYSLLRQPRADSREPSLPAARRGVLPAATLKEVAVRLQRDNLHTAAAGAYEEYLAAADLPDPDRGNVLLEAGNLLAKAGDYEGALARYFRAEQLLGEANLPALRRRIQECLQRLGKHAERGYELKDQLGPRPAGGEGKTAGDQEAGAVVAYLGLDKFTVSDLDDRIAQEIEERAQAVPGIAPERVNELKAQAQKRFSSPQVRMAKLQEILAREVLYREGLEREVDKSRRVQKRIAEFSRDAVVEEMALSALRDRIKISETDLRNYHRANAARYREKASARVRVAVLPDEAKAKELLGAAKSEADFERLAREQSIEPVTRERGGLLEEPLADGEPVPILGLAPDLVKAVLATPAGQAIAEPVKLDPGFAAAYVREKAPERDPPFEDVRERVGRDYLREKEAEAQSALVKELFEKHRVSIVTEAFIPGAEKKTR